MTVFLLIVIGTLLIVLNMRAMKKEKDSFSGTLHNTEENMEEYEVMLGELRKEFSETILELQKEIQEVKAKVSKEEIDKFEKLPINNVQTKDDNKVKKKSVSKEKDVTSSNKVSGEIKPHVEELHHETALEKPINSDGSNSVKINEIEKLLKQGLTVEEISEKLSIGKGEVLLIKELYLK